MKHVFDYVVYLAFVVVLVVSITFPEFNPKPITGVYVVPPKYYTTVKTVFAACVVFFGAWYMVPLVREDLHRLRGRIARRTYKFLVRQGSIIRISPINGNGRSRIEIDVDVVGSVPDDLFEFEVQRCDDGSDKKSMRTITISPSYVDHQSTATIKKKGPWSTTIEIECISGRDSEIEVSARVELVGLGASLPAEIIEEHAG